MVQPNRRHFLRTAVGGVCLQGISRTWGAEGGLEGYVRANTDWLANAALESAFTGRPDHSPRAA